MRFTRIEIRNYRQYKNLDFEFRKNGDKDLHVIIGRNGMGKTNILNAITWCLYGKEPHLGNESKSLPKLNLDSRKVAIEENEAIVNVEVKIFTEDNGKNISYQRKVPIRVENDFELKEVFLVTETDNENNTKAYENEEALEFVNRYMPEKIRQYFYFDNEQLHNYFSIEQNTKIRESVHAISQVDMLTRISDRFNKVKRKMESEAGSKAPEIKSINNKVKNNNDEIENNKMDIAELKREIELSEKTIKENSEKLSGQEDYPELEAKHRSLKEKQETLEDKKEHIRSELLKFVREYRVLLTFYPHAKSVYKMIIEKELNNELPPRIDKSLLKKMLDSHKCIFCKRQLEEEHETEINKLLSQMQVSSETSHLLMSIKSELERAINSAENYEINKKIIMDKLKFIERELKDTDLQLQKIDNIISKFADKEKVKDLHFERAHHEELLKINSQKLGVANKQLQESLKLKYELEKNLNKVIEEEVKCEKLNKLINYSKRAKCIIDDIESEMLLEVKHKMENKTFEYFDRLIWKEFSYKKIELDENYYLDLIHKEGYSCVGSLSAAERALLALSFTLALHEVSGFNSLLFIDTPVARVSDSNRKNFAEVLCEVSENKQIIMTFAPDEYSEDIKNIFNPNAATKVNLSTENESYTYI